MTSDQLSFKSSKTGSENGPGTGTSTIPQSPPISSRTTNPPPPSIALAFELLPPTRVCALFSRGLRRPVTYTHTPRIEISMRVPNGYIPQLRALELIFGRFQAPYFGTEIGGTGDDVGGTVVEEARALWAGWRGIEEYAREVFPVEEAANGRGWMCEEGGG